MRNMTYSDNGTTITRISKARARKMVENGERVYICACNLRPLGPWQVGMWISSDFDKRVDNYEWFHCANDETGRYASFYKEEK